MPGFDRALVGPEATGVDLVLLEISGFDRRIWADSELGKGSVFHVALPLAQRDGSEPPEEGQEKE